MRQEKKGEKKTPPKQSIHISLEEVQMFDVLDKDLKSLIINM